MAPRWSLVAGRAEGQGCVAPILLREEFPSPSACQLQAPADILFQSVVPILCAWPVVAPPVKAVSVGVWRGEGGSPMRSLSRMRGQDPAFVWSWSASADAGEGVGRRPPCSSRFYQLRCLLATRKFIVFQTEKQMCDCQRLKGEGQSAAGSGTRNRCWFLEGQPIPIKRRRHLSGISGSREPGAPHIACCTMQRGTRADWLRGGRSLRPLCQKCQDRKQFPSPMHRLATGVLQQGGEVGWIIEGSLGGRGAGGGVAFPAPGIRLGTGFDIRRGLAQFAGRLAG